MTDAHSKPSQASRPKPGAGSASPHPRTAAPGVKAAPGAKAAGDAKAAAGAKAATGAKTDEKLAAKPDPMDILTADFIAGAGPGSALPPPTGAEVAFAGRSNVGKSSLINAIVQRKSLVRTSSTPGSTRQVNLFEARARDGAVFHMVDLPGYGFAKRSKSEKTAWASLIESYLKTRVTLAVVVIIVDVRRGIEEDDRELIEFIEGEGEAARRPVQVVVVATKLDKVARSARRAAVEAVAKGTGRKVIGFSAETGEGRKELWSAIRRATLGDAPR